VGKGRDQLHAFLTSALCGDERSNSRPQPLYPQRETGSCTHWIRGCVGPRTGLDAVAKRKKFLAPAENQTPVVRPVA